MSVKIKNVGNQHMPPTPGNITVPSMPGLLGIAVITLLSQVIYAAPDVTGDQGLAALPNRWHLPVVVTALSCVTVGLIANIILRIRAEKQRAKALEDLAKQKNLMESVVIAVPDMIFAKDTSGTFVFCNQASAQRTCGGSPEMMIGKTDFDFYPQQQAQQWFDQEQEIIKTGKSMINREMSDTDRQGNPQWCLSTKVPWYGDDGNIIGTVGVVRFITERKIAEQQRAQALEDLAKEKNLMESMAVAIPDLLFAKDKNSAFVFCNQASAQWTCGGSPEMMIGKTDFDFYPQQKAQQWFDQEQEVIKTATPMINREMSGTDRQGNPQWCLSTKVPWYGDDGNIIGTVGVVRFITERKIAEQQRAQALEDLAREKSLLQSMLSAIPDKVFVKDTNSEFVFCNQACAQRTCGGPSEIMIGKTDFDFYPRQKAQEWFDQEQEIMKTAAPMINQETSGTDYNGDFQRCLTTKVPWYDNDGNIIGIVGVIRFITERKLAEEQRERLAETLQETNKELQSMIHVTSHDLRTPLVNIAGFGHELTISCKQLREMFRDIEIPESKRNGFAEIVGKDIPEAVELITASTYKMSLLLDGLLRVNRYGYATMEPTELNMNEMIRDIVKTMEFHLQRAQARVAIETLPDCTGDEIMINQVFSNLLANAAKYLDPARTGVIRISGRQDNNENIYCVEDNGIGIQPDNLRSIFELFYRVDPSEGSGEGLGLAIVQKIANRHSGRVWAESQIGIGSKFFVAIPNRH